MVSPSTLLLFERQTSTAERRASKGASLRRLTFIVRRSSFVAGIVMTWCCAVAGCKSTVDNVDIKDVYGPAGRQARNIVEQADREVKGDRRVGLEEFNAAEKLYEEQKY